MNCHAVNYTISAALSAGLIALGLYGCNNARPVTHTAPHDKGPARSFVVVSTGQDKFYNNNGREIPLPRRGEAFHGQDAQHVTIPMKYKDNNDGTVSDLNAGLMWQKTPIADITWDEAAKGTSRSGLRGYKDWRLPTMKGRKHILTSGRPPRISMAYSPG
jgi:hypothetical protein